MANSAFQLFSCCNSSQGQLSHYSDHELATKLLPPALNCHVLSKTHQANHTISTKGRPALEPAPQPEEVSRVQLIWKRLKHFLPPSAERPPLSRPVLPAQQACAGMGRNAHGLEEHLIAPCPAEPEEHLSCAPRIVLLSAEANPMSHEMQRDYGEFRAEGKWDLSRLSNT